MDKATAERALAAVKKKYEKYLSFDENKDSPPELMENWSIEGERARWAIVWEFNSPDGWAYKWGSTRREDPTGIFTEPLCSFALSVNDGD